MTISLSKLTALEAALEYLIKATPEESLEYLAPGEQAQGDFAKLLTLETALEYLAKVDIGKREYLSPGEKAPEGLKEYPGSRPGVRYYVPGEVKPKEKGGWAGRVGGMLDRIRGRGAEPSELPEEEREIEVVAPPSVGEEEPTGWEKAVLSSDDAREQFEVMAKDLEDVLSSIRPEHKQFLGTPFDDSKLIADNLERVGFTDGTFEGTDRPSGSGIHSEFNWTVFIDGKPFIYKVVPGENRSEQLSYAVDRALGLNVVPYIKAHNMDPDKLHEAFQKSFKDEEFSDYLQVNLARRVDPEFQKSHGMPPAGHWMEFCETCPDSEESSQIIAEMYTTKEGREEFFKLMFLDFITGNDDRHSGNWLVTKDKKALAIDNGFGGGGQKYTPMAETAHRVVGRVDGGMKLGFPWQSQDALKAHLMDLDFDPNEIQEYVTRLRDPATLGAEAEDVFDKYYDFEKIQKAIDPINWSAESFWANDYGAKEGFKKYAVEWMTRGMGGNFEGDTEDETRDDDDWLQPDTWEPMEAINETPSYNWRKGKPDGFLNRIRNWVRQGGESSSPSSHEFHPEFEGATPPSQQGGPQQGRRGRS